MKKVKSNKYVYLLSFVFQCFMAFSFVQNAHAQGASLYTFAASSATYSDLVGGTSVSISSDDATTSALSIGFTFNYCGIGYTQLKVCSNGWITFNTSTSSTLYSNTMANLGTIKPALLPWFDDMRGNPGTASYLTTGTSGSRVFTFEYKNWDCDYSYASNLSIQVKLYEATGVIQYIYRRESGSSYGGSATVGICDGATTSGYLVLNSSGTAPSTSSTSFTTSISSRPADGQMYQFTPPVFCTGTPTAGSSVASPSSFCAGGSVTLSSPTASTGAGITYQWQSSTTGTGSWSNITGATTATYTLVPSAALYYRCLVSCTPSGLGTYSTTIFVGYANSILSTTGATRCGIGTVSLAASGSSGTTIKWYTAASGGLSIGSSSPFTSPTITSSTNFYAGAETNATATDVVPAGTTTANSNSGETPFSLYWTSAHTQYLVMASDLKAAGYGSGTISSLSFNVTSKSSTKAYSNYTIKFAHTSATSLSGMLSPTFTTVYGPTAYSSVTGPNTFSLGSAFTWDGSSNLLVDVCFDNVTPATGYSNNDEVSFVAKSYTATYGAYNDPLNLCGTTSGGSTTSSNSLPQMTITGNKVCSSPRTLVVATVNAAPAFGITGTQTVCNNAVASMSVSTGLSSFSTFKWTPTTALYTDAACTTAYTSGSSASTVYAKSTTVGAIKYYCTAENSSTLCAAIDSAVVTNLPSSVAVLATPNYLCGAGKVVFSLLPSSGYGSAGFQWQSSANNTSFSDSTGMTASSLTTASLSTTRYYRVVLKNSSGTTCLNATSDTALLYNPKIDSVANGVRCAPGKVNLSAWGSDGKTSWYAASSGGSALDTGKSYTTPSIATTTTYYAEVRATPDIAYNVGTGTSTLGGTGLTPFSQYYESSRTQYLIKAADLTAAGITAGPFSAVAFNITTKYSSKDYKGYTMRFAHTSATALSAYLSPSFTTVFGPSLYSPATGTNTFALSGGFSWDGSSNLLVEICFSNATGSYDGWSSDDEVAGTTKTYNCTYGTYNDNSYLCSGTGSYTASSTILPNMVFTRLGCKSARTAVVATVNPLPTPSISPATGPVQICDGNTTTFTGGGGGIYQWSSTTSGALSGATSSTFTTGLGGTYRVIVTNPSTGCKDSSVAVSVNVNPVPTVAITPTGTVPICADSTLKFTSTVTGSGLTYQWFNSGTAITGATSNKLSTPDSGYYTLRVYLGTCSDTSNETKIVVNPLPSASFTKTGPTDAICLGATLELTALTVPSSSSYQWMLNGIDISGATNQVYNASVGGIYTVRIKDVNSCRKVSDTLTIINTPMGIPNLLPKDVRFCEGTEIILYSNAGPYAVSYKWEKDGVLLSDTTEHITTGTLGTYSVTVEDVYGCVLTSSSAHITVDPLPIKPLINKIGYLLTTVNAYASYQWYRNGKAIPSAIYRTYTLMFDGNYYVVVSNSSDCVNVSDTLSIQSLSVKQLSRADIGVLVYPNPTQNKVMIEAPIDLNLIVRDMQGKKVLQLEHPKEVDMSLYADGVYFFTFTDKEGIVIKMDKIVKRTN